MTHDMWHVTHDMWHVTPDTWHMTPDMSGEVELLSRFQLLCSYKRAVLNVTVREFSPPFTCHISHVTCHLSYITCHMSHVTCHMSHVTCHVSHVTCHVSHVTIFTKCWSYLVEGLLSTGGRPCLVSTTKQMGKNTYFTSQNLESSNIFQILIPNVEKKRIIIQISFPEIGKLFVNFSFTSRFGNYASR